MSPPLVTLALAVMLPLAAADHVVPRADLHKGAAAATQAKQANLAKAAKFFSTPRVQDALRAGKLDSARVQQAVSLLGQEELARLASKVDKIQADFAAGALSNQELTYIVIALGTAVLILVIVAA